MFLNMKTLICAGAALNYRFTIIRNDKRRNKQRKHNLCQGKLGNIISFVCDNQIVLSIFKFRNQRRWSFCIIIITYLHDKGFLKQFLGKVRKFPYHFCDNQIVFCILNVCNQRGQSFCIIIITYLPDKGSLKRFLGKVRKFPYLFIVAI